MRPPGRNPLVDHCRIFILESYTIALAGARQSIVNDLCVRLPVVHDLIQTIGGKILDEFLHFRFSQTISVEIAGSLCHLEMNERAVAIESDVFGAEDGHLVVILAWGLVVAAIMRS